MISKLATARWFLVSTFALAALACGLSSITQLVLPAPSPNAPAITATPGKASTAPIIVNAVTSKDAKGDAFDPVGITDSFPAEQKVFHAIVTIKDAPPKTTFRVRWLDAANSKMGETELTSDGSRNLDFTFTPNAGKLPPGSYHVTLDVNGKEDRTLTFRVGADQAQPPSGSLIASVTMAENTKGDAKDPVNPTTTFKNNAPFHAVVAIRDVPANTKYTAAWYVVDVGSAAAPNSLIDSTELTSEGTRNLDFTLTPTSKWPAGAYRVDISANGILQRSVTFTVK